MNRIRRALKIGLFRSANSAEPLRRRVIKRRWTFMQLDVE